jgi:hypothetical protein
VDSWVTLTCNVDTLTILSSEVESQKLTRTAAKTVFSNASDEDGNSFHKYLNSDGVPILEFRFVKDNWEARVPEESHNTMLLDGVPLGPEWKTLPTESRLQVFSRKKGAAVPGLELMVEIRSPHIDKAKSKVEHKNIVSSYQPPYTPFQGQNKIPCAPMDRYQNPLGSQYDLGRDGAFRGCRIAVVHLYTGEGFDFSLPQAALAEKGFEILRWPNEPPPVRELTRVLRESSQLWIISQAGPALLSPEHIDEIKRFFNSGRGLYLWGDNDPYHQEADVLAMALFGTTMQGYLMGDQVVGIQNMEGNVGFVASHPITTGLQHLYEGITIATIGPSPVLKPLIYGSAGNLVAAYYDKEGRRAIIDGGFTRLYHKWDTAGTGRYVKNAAVWLANYERFGMALFKRA